MDYNGHEISDNMMLPETASTLIISECCAIDVAKLEELIGNARDYVKKQTEVGNRYADGLEFVCEVKRDYGDDYDSQMIEFEVLVKRYETDLEKKTRIESEKKFWDGCDAHDKRIEEQLESNRKKRADRRKNDELYCRYEYERRIIERNGCWHSMSFEDWKKKNGIKEN